MNTKGFSSIVITVIVALVVIGGGAFYIQSQPAPEMNTENGDAMEAKDGDAIKSDTHSGDAMSGDAMEKKDGDAMEKKDGNAMEAKDGDAMEAKDGDAMEQKSGDAMEKDTGASAGKYLDYDAAKVAEAASMGDKTVLFFHAGWCPTCRGLNSNIENNLSQIPSGTYIFKTDYDKEQALKQKYGVTYQHTMVQIGAGGEQIAKWGGSPTLSDLLSKIQ